MKIGILDIESSGLLADMIDFTSFPYKLKPSANLWCTVVRDYHTDEVFTAVKEENTPAWMEHTLSRFDIIVAHNGIKFDFVALNLFGVFDYKVGYLGKDDTLFGKPIRFMDTLILSRITNPDRFGGHGLEAWGRRVDNYKTGFRELCIEKGYIDKNAPKGVEFLNYCPEMLDYCIQDTSTTASVYTALCRELTGYGEGWKLAIKQEHKLADIAIRRESLGFFFDKPAALAALEDLTEKLQTLTDKVNPLLPQRPLTQTELNFWTPPKSQFVKDGSLSKNMINFVERVGGQMIDGNEHMFFEGEILKMPLEEPLRTSLPATIDNLDAVKMHLISLGWNPSEWKERDLTKDSKKQIIPLDKRVKALERWYNDTIGGKYKEQRLEYLKADEATVFASIRKRLSDNRPVRVPTSPSIRVGVEKELCPNLIALGEKVAFARDFADYLTFKHRKSTIAGGDIEDMDMDSDVPNTGFLSMYREEDSRVPTPAIEIGASTNRYRHIGVANIPRPTSVYGKEMRSLFGCGEGFVQLGYDFASLEARIEGHYAFDGTDGESYAESLIAEKPNDVHTINSQKLGIPRSDVKAFKYALTYGAQVPKVMKMLAMSRPQAEELFNNFWEAAPSLKELKDTIEAAWLANKKLFVRGIDGRKINTRSQHSILNALFQSAGVICAKYTTVFVMEQMEEKGYCVDPFIGKPDVCSMIEYHDEAQMAVNPKLVKFELFDTEEEAEKFVSEWNGDEQLSAISHGKKWYVCLPNDISIAIDKAIKKVCEMFELRVPLGFEWIVNKNWYGCH